jgi:hypothetical protein
MKTLPRLIMAALIGSSAAVSATEPGTIVFLPTATDIKGCYFRQGEEQAARGRFKTTFTYGEKVCMRAYATGRIGAEVNMQDFVDGQFHKGYVFSWKYPEGTSGFWVVADALAELRPLPRGKHCIEMYVTGPDDRGVVPEHRRLAARGCFTVI